MAVSPSGIAFGDIQAGGSELEQIPEDSTFLCPTRLPWSNLTGARARTTINSTQLRQASHEFPPPRALFSPLAKHRRNSFSDPQGEAGPQGLSASAEKPGAATANGSISTGDDRQVIIGYHKVLVLTRRTAKLRK